MTNNEVWLAICEALGRDPRLPGKATGGEGRDASRTRWLLSQDCADLPAGWRRDMYDGEACDALSNLSQGTSWLLLGFHWSSTPEGNGYWSDLHDELQAVHRKDCSAPVIAEAVRRFKTGRL